MQCLQPALDLWIVWILDRKQHQKLNNSLFGIYEKSIHKDLNSIFKIFHSFWKSEEKLSWAGPSLHQNVGAMTRSQMAKRRCAKVAAVSSYPNYPTQVSDK